MYIYIYICKYIYIYMYKCIYRDIYIFQHTYVCKIHWIHEDSYVRVNIFRYAYRYMSIYK